MDFEVKAFGAISGVVVLRINAESYSAARTKASNQGLTVLSIQARPHFRINEHRERKFGVSMFAQELLALLDAGMELMEALEILGGRSKDVMSAQILERLIHAISEGKTLSSAMTAASKFPPLFIATIKSGENTGNLPDSLRRYIHYYRQVNSLKEKIVSACVYPLILITVGGLVVVFLLTYVVPRFSRVYADLGEDRLPILSKILMQWGKLIGANIPIFLLITAALLGAGLFGITRPIIKARLEIFFWKIPRIGKQLKIYQLARFTRTIAMLLKGGTPLVSALKMTDDLLSNPTLRQGLLAATQQIEQGQNISTCFDRNGLATDVGVRLLIVGERSGSLGETMEKIANFYDEEVSRELEWFTRMFEPALMMGIGVLIGGIVILMYLPIFELASAVQ